MHYLPFSSRGWEEGQFLWDIHAVVTDLHFCASLRLLLADLRHISEFRMNLWLWNNNRSEMLMH